MIHLERTDSKNIDFITLVEQLDRDLAVSDGEEHGFYNQFNGIETIKFAIVAYNDNIPMACGAIKEYDASTVEIKRMYTLPETRGKGIATKILYELENWATQLGYKRCILETGKKQPKAIALYKKLAMQLFPITINILE